MLGDRKLARFMIDDAVKRSEKLKVRNFCRDFVPALRSISCIHTIVAGGLSLAVQRKRAMSHDQRAACMELTHAFTRIYTHHIMVWICCGWCFL